jgi:hypothetical protein
MRQVRGGGKALVVRPVGCPRAIPRSSNSAPGRRAALTSGRRRCCDHGHRRRSGALWPRSRAATGRRVTRRRASTWRLRLRPQHASREVPHGRWGFSQGRELAGSHQRGRGVDRVMEVGGGTIEKSIHLIRQDRDQPRLSMIVLPCSYFRIHGVRVSPINNPSGLSSRVTTCPQGSVRFSTSSL